MYPSAPAEEIARAYDDDPQAAAAEYGAEFRQDLAAFVDRETVEAAVVLGRRELPPAADISYVAFCDPSGGSSDSMTLAIAHADAAGAGVLDCLREERPPFPPESSSPNSPQHSAPTGLPRSWVMPTAGNGPASSSANAASVMWCRKKQSPRSTARHCRY